MEAAGIFVATALFAEFAWPTIPLLVCDGAAGSAGRSYRFVCRLQFVPISCGLHLMGMGTGVVVSRFGVSPFGCSAEAGPGILWHGGCRRSTVGDGAESKMSISGGKLLGGWYIVALLLRVYTVRRRPAQVDEPVIARSVAAGL